MSDYKPASRVLASELNTFQDETDKNLFQSWKTLAYTFTTVGTGVASSTRYGRFLAHLGSNAITPQTTPIAGWGVPLAAATDLPVGVAARTGQLRLVLVLANQALGESGTMMTSVDLAIISGVGTVSGAVSGSSIAPSPLPTYGNVKSYKSAAFSYPATGIFVPRIVYGTITSGFKFWLLLQHRQT